MARASVVSISTHPAPEAQRREQARHVATLADALARGAVVGPEFAAVARLLDAVATLAAWTPDDRTGRPEPTAADYAEAARILDRDHLRRPTPRP